jgi:hypothetical protein
MSRGTISQSDSTISPMACKSDVCCVYGLRAVILRDSEPENQWTASKRLSLARQEWLMDPRAVDEGLDARDKRMFNSGEVQAFCCPFDLN